MPQWTLIIIVSLVLGTGASVLAQLFSKRRRPAVLSPMHRRLASRETRESPGTPRFLRCLYKLIHRREPPDRMRLDYSVWFLAWKFLRKFINVSIAPFIPFNGVRIFLYRRVGYKIGKHVFIGMRCYLDDRYPEMLTIGDHVDISYLVTFAVHGAGQNPSPIIIKDYCYVGACAILVSGRNGITLGEGSVIGAGTLVNRSIPDWKVAVGNPARVIRDAPREDLERRHDPELWTRCPEERTAE